MLVWMGSFLLYFPISHHWMCCKLPLSFLVSYAITILLFLGKDFVVGDMLQVWAKSLCLSHILDVQNLNTKSFSVCFYTLALCPSWWTSSWISQHLTPGNCWKLRIFYCVFERKSCCHFCCYLTWHSTLKIWDLCRNLSGNAISGSLPQDWASGNVLQRLTTLNLDNNNISGIFWKDLALWELSVCPWLQYNSGTDSLPVVSDTSSQARNICPSTSAWKHRLKMAQIVHTMQELYLLDGQMHSEIWLYSIWVTILSLALFLQHMAPVQPFHYCRQDESSSWMSNRLFASLED